MTEIDNQDSKFFQEIFTSKKSKNQLKNKMEMLKKSKENKLEEKFDIFQPKIESISDYTTSPSEIFKQKFSDDFKEKERNSLNTFYDYLKGEEGIDYQPVSPEFCDNFELTIEELDELYEQQVKFYDGSALKEIIYEANHNPVYQWRDIMEDKQMFDYTFREKDVKYYPGTQKGLEPEDDPEAFADWYIKNIPKTYLPILEDLRNKYEDEFNLKQTEESGISDVSMPAILQNKYLDYEIPFLQPEEEIFNDPNDLDYEISIIPENIPLEWNTSQEYIERWSIFRLFPIFIKFQKDLSNFFSNLEKNKSIPFNPDSNYFALPSLYMYYNTLPKFMRENIIVMNVARSLEFKKHQLTLKEKELALNFACQFTLPMDEYTREILKQAVISRKVYLTTEEEEHILAGYSELQEDDSKKEKENLEKVKKPGEVVTRAADWPTPDRHTDMDIPEEELNYIPIDYYDNEDGFWDTYIQWKERQYSKAEMISYRPYTKH